MIAVMVIPYSIGYSACNLCKDGHIMLLRIHGDSCGCVVVTIVEIRCHDSASSLPFSYGTAMIFFRE